MVDVKQKNARNDALQYRQFVQPRTNLWVFAYGSLMWDPGFPFVRWSPALIYGYHRAMCVSSSRWRGTPDRPGLVLGLDRGGACRGIAFLVSAADVAITLQELWAREMQRRIYLPRLLRARLPDQTVPALAFVADLRHAEYSGQLTLQQTAERIANCCGARGPNLEYLVRTIDHLAELGVHDHYLLRLLEAARQSTR